MDLRDARLDDAADACEVLRRSISELCVADHGNDEAVLANWLANKTPEIVASWIARADNSVLAALEGNAIVGVGAVTDTREITLNYVSPDARFRGVSRAVLIALEGRARGRGHIFYYVTSSETAKRFCYANNYIENGRGRQVRNPERLQCPSRSAGHSPDLQNQTRQQDTKNYREMVVALAVDTGHVAAAGRPLVDVGDRIQSACHIRLLHDFHATEVGISRHRNNFC